MNGMGIGVEEDQNIGIDCTHREVQYVGVIVPSRVEVRLASRITQDIDWADERSEPVGGSRRSILVDDVDVLVPQMRERTCRSRDEKPNPYGVAIVCREKGRPHR